jgi:hypothetical protein
MSPEKNNTMNKLIAPFALLSVALLGSACTTTSRAAVPTFASAPSSAAPSRLDVETKSPTPRAPREQFHFTSSEGRRAAIGAIGPGPRPAPQSERGSR